MAETPSKIHYPTNADTFDPAGDMESLARSVTHIVPVANATERNAIADAFNPTPDRPLYVDRADTGTLERNAGNGWEAYTRPRRYVGAEVFSASSFGPLLEATADVIPGADGQPQTVIVNVRIGGPHDVVSSGGQNTSVGTLHEQLRPTAVHPVLVSAGDNAATATVAASGNLAIRWASGTLFNQLVLSFLASFPVR